MAKDVLEIITVFSARLYGSRSHKNKSFLEKLNEAASDTLMLLAHKIELRPTPEQREYLDKACGSKRHCFNQLLAHFSLPENKWSKAAAYQYYITVIRKEFDWYTEVSSRVTRNAIDDLECAFKHFFRRVKAKQKAGFPRFKKKDCHDSFALRESAKFDVVGRDTALKS